MAGVNSKSTFLKSGLTFRDRKYLNERVEAGATAEQIAFELRATVEVVQRFIDISPSRKVEKPREDEILQSNEEDGHESPRQEKSSDEKAEAKEVTPRPRRRRRKVED